MFVTDVRTEGLRHSVQLTGLGRRVDLPSGAAGAAVGDALMLWAGTLSPARLTQTLLRLGAASSAEAVELTVEKGWLTGVGTDAGHELVALLAPGERRFAVEVTIEADPPFFRRLREHAVRDPRLVTALGQAPTLGVKIGWFLSADGNSTTVGLLGLTVGKSGFPVTGSERPAWAPAVLKEVGERFARVRSEDSLEALGERLLSVATGLSGERRARLETGCAATARAPFHLGRLSWVRVGDAVVPAFGTDLVRASRLGPAGQHAAALIEQVYVEQPDVLVVMGCGAGFSSAARVKRWVERRTDGADATLEQVFFADGGR